MYRKDWRIVYKKYNAVLEQLYINGFPTEHFRFNGKAMPIIAGGQDPTVDRTISEGNDDGYVTVADPWFSRTSAYLTAGYYADPDWGEEHAFLRWQDVTISGTITTSYVEIYIESGDVTGSPELKVHGVDEDNPDGPTNYTEFMADPLTHEGIDWDAPYDVDQYTQSPSLNAVFQELVDSYTIEGDAIMVQLRNDHALSGFNDVSFVAYNHATADSPAKLHIEYTTEVVSRRIFITAA